MSRVPRRPDIKQNWLLVDRIRFLQEREQRYPYKVETPLAAPRPEAIQALALYGEFCRVPFPERGVAVWRFEERLAADRFEQEWGVGRKG